MRKYIYSVLCLVLSIFCGLNLAGQCVEGFVNGNPGSVSIACDDPGGVAISATSPVIPASAIQWSNGQTGDFTFTPDCNNLGCQEFTPCIPAGTMIAQQCVPFSSLGVTLNGSVPAGGSQTITFDIEDICYVPGAVYSGSLGIVLSGAGDVSLSVVQPDGVTQGPLTFDLDLINNLSPVPLSLLGLDVDPNGTWQIVIADAGAGNFSYTINPSSEICIDAQDLAGVVCSDPVEVCVFGGCPDFISVQASETAICSGGSFMLDATLDPLDAPNVTYQWSGNGIDATNESSSCPMLSITNTTCATVTESYFVTITCTNDNSVIANNVQVDVDVYPEIDGSLAVIDNTTNVNDPNCSIAISYPPCPGFAINGNTSFSPGDNGVTADFVISNGNPDCDVTVSSVVNCIGNCVPPDVTATVSGCDANGNFTVSIVVNNMGNSVDFDIVLSNGSTQNITAPGGTYVFGTFASGSSINIKIIDANDPNCSLNLGEFTRNCSTCPELVVLNNIPSDACNGDIVNLIANPNQGTENIDYSVQWYENGVAISGGNSAAYIHTLNTGDRCNAASYTYTAVMTCLNGGTPATTTMLNVGPINVYPTPEEGIDFVFENCSVTPIDNCGNLVINTGSATDPAPGGFTTVNYTVSVSGSPAFCQTTGTTTIDCPDCADYPGNGASSETVVCWGDSFDFTNASSAVSSLGYEVGYAITTSPPSTYPSTAALINASIGGVYGAFAAPGSISSQTYVNDGSLINPTSACGELLYFTPFLSFACQSYTAIDDGGSIFTENADGITVPGIGGITLAVPQVPYCSGLVNYNIELCVEDQTVDSEEPLSEDAFFGLISGLPGGIYSNFPNIDDKHVSCTTFLGFCTGPECYNQNGWTADPSGEQISITTANLLFGTDQLDWDFEVNVNCNSTFPTICPDCEVIGAPVAVRFLPQLNINTIPAPADLCEGESIDLFALNPAVSNAASGTYTWYEGASSGGLMISDASSVVPPVGTTTYCVAYSYCQTGDCVAETCVDVTVDPLPVLTAPTLGPICQGEFFDLTTVEGNIATGGGFFQWYIGGDYNAGGAFIGNPSIVIPVGSEQYCAKFTNSNGCVNSICASFTYKPRPQLLSAAPILCADEVLDLASLNPQISTVAGTFDWYAVDPALGGTVLTNTVVTNPVNSAMYWVTFTETATGCSATTSITLTVDPLPVLNAMTATLCENDPLDLTNIQSQATTAAGTYTWYDGDPATTGVLVGTPTAVFPAPGQQYCLEFTDATTNCVNVECFTPTVNLLPITTDFAPPPFCANGSPYDVAQYESTLGTGTFTWYDGDPSTTGIIINGAAVNLANGTQTDLWFTLTDPVTGCNVSQSFQVEVLEEVLGATAVYDCDLDQIVVDLTTATGGSGGYVVSAASPNQNGDSVGDNISWTIIVEDSNGCQQVAITDVNICNACQAVAPTMTLTGPACADGSIGNPILVGDSGDGSANPGEITEYILLTNLDTILQVGTLADMQAGFAGMAQDSTMCVRSITHNQAELDIIIADLDACVQAQLAGLSLYTILGLPTTGNTVQGILAGIGNVAPDANFAVDQIETLIGGSGGGPGFGGSVDVGDLLGLGAGVVVCQIPAFCYNISESVCATLGDCGCNSIAPSVTINGGDCGDGTLGAPFTVTDNGDGFLDTGDITEYIMTSSLDTIILVGSLATMDAELNSLPQDSSICIKTITHNQAELDGLIADLDACVQSQLAGLSLYTILGLPVTGNTLEGILSGIGNVAPDASFAINQIETLIGGSGGGPGLGGSVDVGDLLGLGAGVVVCDVLPFCYNIGPASCITVGPCSIVPGCTDPCAPNFDPLANQDNGSCQPYSTVCNTDCLLGDLEVWDPAICGCVVTTVSIVGCTNPTACNYSATANCDDGSCNTVYGCTDPTACNYDSNATCSNTSCIYETACDIDFCTNGGTYTWDATTCACVLDVATVLGCTNATACNYNANANCDDGSCLTVFGCTNPGACNYDPTAQCDDGSCNTVYGCTNSAACNYNPVANCDDGSCNTVYGCTDNTACNYDPNANCSDASCIYQTACDLDPCTNGGTYVWDTNTCACVLDIATVLGCTNSAACNYNPNANCDDGSCNTIYGCTDPTACNYNAAATCDDGNCVPNTDPGTCNTDCLLGNIEIWNASTCSCELLITTVSGCTSSGATNYNPNANCDDGSCVFPPEGCTNPCSPNYNPDALVNDGSCLPEELGCTDPTACNYAPTAICDDGSCIPSTDPGTCNTDCLVGDIEIWNASTCSCEISVFTIAGCTNPQANNYNANANCDDGSCVIGADCQLNIPMPYAGWHMISSYCRPDPDSITQVFAPIVNDVIQVKNLVGQVYVPSFNNFNTFTTWDITQGYLVKVANPVTLPILGGTEVDLNIDNIPVYTGWNMIAYWLQGDSDPVDVFDNIATDVIQVKNLSGAYVPSFNDFNNMGNMKETRGYQVKMNAPQTLWYDAADILPRPAPGTIGEIERLSPVHFTKNIKPNPNTSTMLIMDDENNPMNYGDEIGVFTPDGVLVGAYVYENDMLGGLVFGDDETEEGKDGILENERYIFKVWDRLMDTEREVEMEFIQGSATYLKDDLCAVSFKSDGVTGINEIAGLNITVSPNPATTKVLFDIDLESSEFLSIEVYQVDGQLVDVVAKQSFGAGNTQLIYDVSELSSGLYMYRVTDGEKSYTERFTVVD